MVTEEKGFGNFVYAGFWIRLWAHVIDSVLIALITIPAVISVYGYNYLILSDVLVFLDPFPGALFFLDPFSGDLFFLGPMDFFITVVLPGTAVVLFWVYRQATPGKMAISAKIVDAVTGEKPSTGQCIGRYFAYIPSTLVFFLGFIWIAFDARKQGWHDKLAGTVVVRHKNFGVEDVAFGNRASFSAGDKAKLPE